MVSLTAKLLFSKAQTDTRNGSHSVSSFKLDKQVETHGVITLAIEVELEILTI
ncbi:MAG: hypothetical protein ACKESB_02965 [Candidatus Hodgkinia cicadicola]